MTYTPLSPDIVPRIRANDQAAHEELYAYICSLQGALFYEFGRGMAHDTYIAAVEKFRQKDREIESPHLFIWGILSNKKLGSIHKRSRRRRVWEKYSPSKTCAVRGETLPLVGQQIDSDELIARDEQRRIVYNLLPRLAPREREVMNLVLAGYGKQQVVARLGISEKSYSIAKSRGIKHARRLLKEITNGKAASGNRNGGR